MSTDKSLALVETVHQLGFNSVEEFAVEKVKEKILHDLKTCSQNIEFYEKKYNMNYSQFLFSYLTLSQGDVFEREDNLQDWGAEQKLMRIYEKQLAKLS